jgi:hypothetical protein
MPLMSPTSVKKLEDLSTLTLMCAVVASAVLAATIALFYFGIFAAHVALYVEYFAAATALAIVGIVRFGMRETADSEPALSKRLYRRAKVAFVVAMLFPVVAVLGIPF